MFRSARRQRYKSRSHRSPSLLDTRALCQPTSKQPASFNARQVVIHTCSVLVLRIECASSKMTRLQRTPRSPPATTGYTAYIRDKIQEFNVDVVVFTFETEPISTQRYLQTHTQARPPTPINPSLSMRLASSHLPVLHFLLLLLLPLLPVRWILWQSRRPRAWPSRSRAPRTSSGPRPVGTALAWTCVRVCFACTTHV